MEKRVSITLLFVDLLNQMLHQSCEVMASLIIHEKGRNQNH